MLLALGTTIVVISTFGTGFRLALLLAWHTLLFRKLRGLLLSRPPAIVGIAVIAVVPTLVRRFVLFVVTALLLMQARVLFTTLVIALFLTLVTTFLLNFRMFPTMFARFEFAIVTAFELGGTTFSAILLRLELLGVVVTLLTLVAIATIPAFGLERLATLVFATILVTPAGTVRPAGTFAVGTAIAVLPTARIACRLRLLKRPAEYRLGHFTYEFQHFRRIRGHVDRFDRQSGLTHHATGPAALVRQNDGHHVTGMTGSRGSSGTMQEGFRIFRRFDLHHEFHTGNVDASRGHIGGHHNVHIAGVEGGQIAVTLVLAQIAVQFSRRNAVLR